MPGYGRRPDSKRRAGDAQSAWEEDVSIPTNLKRHRLIADVRAAGMSYQSTSTISSRRRGAKPTVSMPSAATAA